MNAHIFIDNNYFKLPGVATARKRNLFCPLRDIDIFEELDSNYLLKELGLVVKREYRRMNIGVELYSRP